MKLYKLDDYRPKENKVERPTTMWYLRNYPVFFGILTSIIIMSMLMLAGVLN